MVYMFNEVFEASQAIRRLKVQGARNIAKYAIKILINFSRELDVASRGEFIKAVLKASKILCEARPTEPLMRNGLKFISRSIYESDEYKVEDLKMLVEEAGNLFIKMVENSLEKICIFGAKRIRDGLTILTHCHSSTVNEVLIRAYKNGRRFNVICTETRPLFQGRITARKLADIGIKTTMIVDSAVRFFMNDVDLVFVGADAITSEGNIVNKIGTSQIALIAHEARTPFYVITELLKFSPHTMYGDYERIEERDPSEVWKSPPIGVEIRNPAFDITRRDYIHGIICEEGIISPHIVIEVINRRYPWLYTSQ